MNLMICISTLEKIYRKKLSILLQSNKIKFTTQNTKFNQVLNNV